MIDMGTDRKPKFFAKPVEDRFTRTREITYVPSDMNELLNKLSGEEVERIQGEVLSIYEFMRQKASSDLNLTISQL